MTETFELRSANGATTTDFDYRGELSTDLVRGCLVGADCREKMGDSGERLLAIDPGGVGTSHPRLN